MSAIADLAAHPDVGRVAEIVREVAVAEVLSRFRKLADGDISEKNGPQDLVTVADQESERVLTARLTDLMPGSVAVGEEATAASADVIDRLRDDAPVWVLDPVDGTFNFAHGETGFALIVALVVGGETRAGWIHMPVENKTATVEQGSGAWLEGERMATADPGAIEQMVGQATFNNFPTETRPAAKAQAKAFKQFGALRCAAREYVELCTGKRHFMYYRSLKPWDHAAGVLMARESGGHDARPGTGEPYRVVDPGRGMLVAASEPAWNRVATHFGVA